VSDARRSVPAALLPGILAALWLHLHNLDATEGRRESAALPDLYIDQPVWRNFDSHGLLQRELRAVRLEKWPADSLARLDQPQLLLVDAQRQRWRAQADLGRLDEDRHRLHLEQQVRLWREAQDGDLVISTETLQINEQNGLIETDRAVVLEAGSWHFTATGLRAEPGRLHLLGDVRGIHE
jgi:LPS export ABC transporter protein LptC